MKILILTLEFPPFAGGAGIYSHDLAKGFTNLGHKVTVLTRQYKNKKEQLEIDKKLLNIGITVNRMFWVPKIWRLCCYFTALKFLIQYRSDFEKIIITNNSALELLSFMDNKILGDYNIALHGTESNLYFKHYNLLNKLRYSKRGITKLLLEANRVICVSNFTAELTAKNIPAIRQKLVVVHNGIDLDRLHGQENDKNLFLPFLFNETDYYVVSIGRIIKDKGHDILIKSFLKVVKKIPNAKLLIIGEGPNKFRLQRLVIELRLSNHVFLLGYLDNNSMLYVLKKSDLFALISRGEKRIEGFGLVYLEANACKKIVIAGRTGGVPEAVEDGVSGLLVNPYDSGECANAIITLLFDKKRRKEMEKKAYKRVIDSFTNVKMAERTLMAIR